MQILHVLYDSPQNPWLGGGAALRENAIEHEFAKILDKFTYISGGFPNCKFSNGLGVSTHYFTPHLGSYFLSRLLFSLFAHFLIKKITRNQKFDILVEDISSFNIFFPGLCWKGPMVSLVHNYLGKQCFKKLGIFGILPYLLERHYFKSRKNYIAVSESLKKAILSLNPNARVQVIYNGIDDEAFRHIIRPDAQKIGFMGRIEINQKGLDTFISALKILTQNGEHPKALIIGGGKDESRLKKLIVDNDLEGIVELTGRLGCERFERISECKIMCMPSRYEGWGIAAIEAAAVGIPVIASNIEGLNEAVIQDKTGRLICATSEKLASEIKRLYKADNQEISKAAREHAKKFRWDAIAKQQRNFYQEIISGNFNS